MAERSDDNLAMLAGILGPLASALHSRHAPVVSLALRCMGLLLGLPLHGAAPCISLQSSLSARFRVKSAVMVHAWRSR